VSRCRYWTMQEIRTVHARLVAGERTADVAADVGRSVDAVHKQLSKHGLQIPRRAEPARHRHPRWREAVARVLAGELPVDVALDLGVSRRTVNRWCRSQGVDGRYLRTEREGRRHLGRLAYCARLDGARWRECPGGRSGYAPAKRYAERAGLPWPPRSST